jgi:hypothetical protein
LGLGFGREGNPKEESGKDQSKEASGWVCRKGGSYGLGSSGPQGNRKREGSVRIKVKFLEKDQQIPSQASQGWSGHVIKVALQTFSCKTKE